MKEETLVELLERRFVTADGVIIWNEQVKGLISGAINKASKNFVCKHHFRHIEEDGIIYCTDCNDKLGLQTDL